MGKWYLEVKPERQTWCVTRPNGRRWIGQHYPFTDSCLNKVLEKSMGVYTGWLKMELRDEGIKDGEPWMLDADNTSYKLVTTEFMMRINKILQNLVDENNPSDE